VVVTFPHRFTTAEYSIAVRRPYLHMSRVSWHTTPGSVSENRRPSPSFESIRKLPALAPMHSLVSWYPVGLSHCALSSRKAIQRHRVYKPRHSAPPPLALPISSTDRNRIIIGAACNIIIGSADESRKWCRTIVVAHRSFSRERGNFGQQKKLSRRYFGANDLRRVENGDSE